MKYQVDKLPLVLLGSSEMMEVISKLPTVYEEIQTYSQGNRVIVVSNVNNQQQAVSFKADETTLKMTFEFLSAKELSKAVSTANPTDCTESTGLELVFLCVWELISYAEIETLTYFACMANPNLGEIQIVAFKTEEEDSWFDFQDVCEALQVINYKWEFLTVTGRVSLDNSEESLWIMAEGGSRLELFLSPQGDGISRLIEIIAFEP